jgi:DnaK suppressor protein
MVLVAPTLGRIMDAAHDDLRERLEALRREAEEAIESLVARDGPVELDQTVQGRVSRIDAITQQEMARASKLRLQQQVLRIDAALARMADGSYGLCSRARRKSSRGACRPIPLPSCACHA